MRQLIGYVINLDRSPERLQQFNQHKDSNLFKRISAVDGRLLGQLNDLGYVFNVDKAKDHYRRDISLGEVGCTLSHLFCYKEISLCHDVQLNEFCIIAEDDITLDDYFSLHLTQLISQLENAPFDLILLSTVPLEYEYNNQTEWLLYPNPFDPLDFTGSALYLIRKSSAVQITERVKSEKPHWLADDFTANFPKDRIAILFPFLGISPRPNKENSLLELERSIAKQK